MRAGLKDIRFIDDLSTDLPKAVLADGKRLRQVLLNLLNNAVKFTEKGQVSFSVERLADSGTGDNHALLRFTVTDTGIGIPQDKLADIFMPYEQVDNHITRAEGSGLGLSISQHLLTLMGQALHVESQVGQGSRFWFDLSLPVIAHTSADSPQPSPAENTPRRYTGEKRTVLIIDDDDFNREVLSKILSQYDFKVMDVANGEAALAILAHTQVDLVLLDILMPGMDGFEVLENIRRLPEASQLKVIALAAFAFSNRPGTSKQCHL